MLSPLETIQERSASPRELVLAIVDAITALDLLERQGSHVLGWEGWLRYSDGHLGHSERYQGTTDLSALQSVAAFELCRRTMREAQEEFERSPERNARELLFCITHDV